MSKLSFELKFLGRRTIGLVAALGIALIIACGHDLDRSGNAKSVATPVSTENPRKIDPQSDHTATMLTDLYEAKNCRSFFEAFPNSFAEFDRLYGYDEKTGGHALYPYYEGHISYFFGCPDIPPGEKLKKAVQIGIDGRWEADASALVQGASYDLIKEHPNEAKEILDALPDTKASSYWYYLIDGPHPGDKENIKKVNLLKDVLGKDSKQTKLLSKQYKKLLVDWSDH